MEKDFKGISEKILEKNDTFSKMKNDNLFKEKIGEQFQKVEELAAEIPGKVHSDALRRRFKDRFNSRERTGISESDYEGALRKEFRAINKKIPVEELSTTQLVDQFRKNNKSLGQYFEPGKSSALNNAKRDSLLEYNRAIEDVIRNKYPKGEFKDLFESTNKRWSEIRDVEQINEFVDKMFEGKVNYSQAKKLFAQDKGNSARPFKRALGEEGFKDFKALTEDLLSTEKPMSYLKAAKDAGFDDLAKTAAAYLISPKLGLSKHVLKYGK